MNDALMHAKYLPFTKAELGQHFAPVATPPDGRHLKHFEDSIHRWTEYTQSTAPGHLTDPSVTRLARQMEKDERFWTACALMSLFHRAGDDDARRKAFAQLLVRAGLSCPGQFDNWDEALTGKLSLFFEVNLPSPRKYREWLRAHLSERVVIPYVQEAAATRGDLVEGPTKADAMLLAEDTGVAVVFEAKVLSDVSTNITFDVARNQIARLLDVILEDAGSRPPLSSRRPELTSLVLVTPSLFRPPSADGLDRSRLYGWLMPAYQNPKGDLLAQHLPHREKVALDGVAGRLGWVSWEDFNAVVNGACPWLPTPGPPGALDPVGVPA